MLSTVPTAGPSTKGDDDHRENETARRVVGSNVHDRPTIRLLNAAVKLGFTLLAIDLQQGGVPM